MSQERLEKKKDGRLRRKLDQEKVFYLFWLLAGRNCTKFARRWEWASEKFNSKYNTQSINQRYLSSFQQFEFINACPLETGYVFLVTSTRN